MGHVLNIHEVDDFRLDPYQRPEAGAADVVIRVKACGICGSDLTYITHGGIHRKPGGVTPLGHDAPGDVMFVGTDVSGLDVGQSVIVNPIGSPSYVGSGGRDGPFHQALMVRGPKRGARPLALPENGR